MNALKSTNYNNVKNILNSKSKGYWKVKSIEIIKKKSSKSIYALKLLNQHNSKYPKFIQITKCSTMPKIVLKKNNSRNEKHIFVTAEDKSLYSKMKKSNDFNGFNEELVNLSNLPFIYFNRKFPYEPRKFKEVVLESRKLRAYQDYIVKHDQLLSNKDRDNTNDNNTSPTNANNKQSNVLKFICRNGNTNIDANINTGLSTNDKTKANQIQGVNMSNLHHYKFNSIVNIKQSIGNVCVNSSSEMLSSSSYICQSINKRNEKYLLCKSLECTLSGTQKDNQTNGKYIQCSNHNNDNPIKELNFSKTNCFSIKKLKFNNRVFKKTNNSLNNI